MSDTRTTVTEDRTDTLRTIVRHTPDGELYVIEYCSLWRDDKCVGVRILEAAGPVAIRDIDPDAGPLLHQTPAIMSRIHAFELSSDDAAWLDAEDHAGRLTYPIGG